MFFTETHRPLIGKPDGAFLGKSESGAMVYLIFDGLEANNVFEYAIMRGMPRDPIKIVYADSCRISETRMRQWNVTFKQIPYEVNVF